MASDVEQLAGGYWRGVAEHFITAQINKPFFGRPYLKLGQCFGLWGYHFELGGMLGSKHRAKLDAFLHAFVGMSGEAGAAERFVVAVANKILDQRSLHSMNQWDYVAAHLGDRCSYYKRDNWHYLLMERGADKIPPHVAAKNAWFYAEDGAALGAVLLMSCERCLNERMYQFRKRSGNKCTILDWTSGQSRSHHGAMRTTRKKRTRFSWNTAENLAQTIVRPLETSGGLSRY